MIAFSKSSVFFLILAGLCILGALYFPIWRIELDAPQYPEGLCLLIFANKMGGDVEIINGLNHYIGMKTLHAEEFVEFVVLPYIIGFFGLWTILSAFIKNRKMVLLILLSFTLFGMLAMYDFWRWEYTYGHNLDPTAAIIVPGMEYQPPLIGYKQLLNFGAYSIPDIGGWLMLLGGFLIALVYGIEAGWLARILRKNKRIAFFALPTMVLISCSVNGPDPIVLNKDTCAFCKMTISDGRFGTELITKKGRVFKFDDISCLLDYKKKNSDKAIQNHYVHNYAGDNELIPAETAYYIKGGKLNSPMGGNIAAFTTEKASNVATAKLDCIKTDWSLLNK